MAFHTDLPPTWFVVVDGARFDSGDVIRVLPGSSDGITAFRSSGSVQTDLSYGGLEEMLARGELLPVTDDEAHLLVEALPAAPDTKGA